MLLQKSHNNSQITLWSPLHTAHERKWLAVTPPVPAWALGPTANSRAANLAHSHLLPRLKLAHEAPVALERSQPLNLIGRPSSVWGGTKHPRPACYPANPSPFPFSRSPPHLQHPHGGGWTLARGWRTRRRRWWEAPLARGRDPPLPLCFFSPISHHSKQRRQQWSAMTGGLTVMARASTTGTRPRPSPSFFSLLYFFPLPLFPSLVKCKIQRVVPPMVA
jgi:hypothetical protein